MNQKISNKLSWILILIAVCIFHHADAAMTSKEIESVQIQVSLNKSKLITIDNNVVEISQGNPQVADFPVADEAAETSFYPPNQILIRGKSLGTTNLYLWGANQKLLRILDIEVTHDLESLKTKLNELLPNENIGVRSSQKNIILSGEVSGLDKMQAAVDLAQGYLGASSALGSGGGSGSKGAGGDGNINVSTNTAKPTVDPSKGATPKVINLMSVGGAQQVMLAVKVAEIDRKVLKGLDVKFSALQVSDSFSIGAINGGGSLSPAGIGGLFNRHSFDAGAVFLQAISGEFIFNLTIDAANDQQLAKILAEPTLTTLSGQEATFISGGEFPIPVPQGGTNGAITITFKEFGIGLRFVPVVLDSGRINLNMNVSVSELSEDAAVVAQAGETNTQFSIPSLTKREASSTLELADGQTMSIAGLISDKLRENVNKFPGLGDIPGLGALFRSEKFITQQTELVIFVTPRLAKPVLAKNAQLPTDSFVAPDDVDFYILGRTESRKVRNRWVENAGNATANKGGLDGEYGQQLMEGGK